MNAPHSGAGDFHVFVRLVHGAPCVFLRPPVAKQTISVTRYLNPGGGTRWCASSTRGFAFNLGVDHDAVNEVIDDGGDGVDAAEALVKCGGSGGIGLDHIKLASNFPWYLASCGGEQQRAMLLRNQGRGRR